MMGTKERHFAPLIHVSVEELVPHDHFYRHLERTLDLSFVREFVQGTYAGGGRPSIDPVVFFKLQLVMFFEDIRSERLLMRQAADRLSVLWYLGYDLGEPLPDHSSLTRIRERYGVEIFRRFFDQIVEQCQQAGLVWGKELYFDGTKMEANASLDSLKPRFAVEAHLANLFERDAEEPAQEREQNPSQEAAPPEPGQPEETNLPTPLPVALSPEERAGSRYGLPHALCGRWGQSTHHSPRLGDPFRGDGQPTHARFALARALPLETVAQTSHGGPQVRHRRKSGCHREPAHPCLHSLARSGPPDGVL